MKEPAGHLETLLELETRHEDLLRRLDELDQQVQKVLRRCHVNPVEEPALAGQIAGTLAPEHARPDPPAE